LRSTFVLTEANTLLEDNSDNGSSVTTAAAALGC